MENGESNSRHEVQSKCSYICAINIRKHFKKPNRIHDIALACNDKINAWI